MLSNLQLFEKILAEELLREIEFVLDVYEGGAPAKKDFLDKVLDLLKRGTLDLIADIPFPGSKLAADVATVIVKNTVEYILDWSNDKRHEKFAETGAASLYQEDYEKFRIIAEMTAMEAARRYQFWISERLADDPLQGVVPFANTGVARMLTHVLSHKLPLEKSSLLIGLICGHSGAFITGYSNTELQVKQDYRTGFPQAVKKKLGKGCFTAEGAYARSPFITSDNKLWVLWDKDKAVHKEKYRQQQSNVTWWQKVKMVFNTEHLFNYGYASKMDVGPKLDPKYGFVAVPDSMRVYFYGHLKDSEVVQDKTQFSPELQKMCNDYKPVWVTINRQELEGYLTSMPRVSLLEHCKGKSSNVERVFYIANTDADYDFTGLNFEDADLSECVFDYCKFVGKLTGSKWQNSYLRGADFSAVTDCTGVIFIGAYLEFLSAEGQNFKNSNFTQAHFQYANLTRADLTGCIVLGTRWEFAKLIEIVEPDRDIRAEQTRQKDLLTRNIENIKELQLAQNQQKQDLMGLQTALSKFKQEQGNQSTDVSEKLMDLVTQLIQEQSSRLSLENYCRTTVLRLQQEIELTQQHQTEKAQELEQRIEQLETRQQLVELELKQQDFNQLIQDMRQVFTQDQRQLSSTVERLQERFEVLTGRVGRLEDQVAELQIQTDIALLNEQRRTEVEINIRQYLRHSYQRGYKITGLFGAEMTMKKEYVHFQGAVEKGVSAQNQNNTEKYNVLLDQLFWSSEKILNNPESNDKNCLVNENKRQCPSIVLLEGIPGIGKSSVISFVTDLWSNESLWTQFDWLFVLPLRQLKEGGFINVASSGQHLLLEWIYHACLSKSPCTLSEFKSIWFHSIEKQLLSGKILLILEGFDERSQQSYLFENIVEELLFGKYSQVLKLITSRPYGVEHLPQQKRSFTITGFDPDNIKTYIEEYFQDTGKTNSLLALIQAKFNLQQLASIPLLLNILCGLYEGGAQLRQLRTNTDLYQEMDMLLQKRAAINRSDPMLRQIWGSGHKKEYQKTKQLFLAELAFIGIEGSEQEQFTFPVTLVEWLLQKYQVHPYFSNDFIKALKNLGIIGSKTCMEVTEDDELLEFTHSTFKEHYAARHIASQLHLPSIQFFILKQWNNPRYQEVWIRTAGLLKAMPEQLQQYVNLIANIKDLLGEYHAALIVRVAEEALDENTEIILESLLAMIGAYFQECYLRYRNNHDLFHKATEFLVALCRKSQRVKTYITQHANYWTNIFQDISNSIQREQAEMFIGHIGFAGLDIVNFWKQKILDSPDKIGESSVFDTPWLYLIYFSDNLISTILNELLTDSLEEKLEYILTGFYLRSKKGRQLFSSASQTKLLSKLQEQDKLPSRQCNIVHMLFEFSYPLTDEVKQTLKRIRQDSSADSMDLKNTITECFCITNDVDEVTWCLDKMLDTTETNTFRQRIIEEALSQVTNKNLLTDLVIPKFFTLVGEEQHPEVLRLAALGFTKTANFGLRRNYCGILRLLPISPLSTPQIKELWQLFESIDKKTDLAEAVLRFLLTIDNKQKVLIDNFDKLCICWKSTSQLELRNLIIGTFAEVEELRPRIIDFLLHQLQSADSITEQEQAWKVLSSVNPDVEQEKILLALLDMINNALPAQKEIEEAKNILLLLCLLDEDGSQRFIEGLQENIFRWFIEFVYSNEKMLSEKVFEKIQLLVTSSSLPRGNCVYVLFLFCLSEPMRYKQLYPIIEELANQNSDDLNFILDSIWVRMAVTLSNRDIGSLLQALNERTSSFNEILFEKSVGTSESIAQLLLKTVSTSETEEQIIFRVASHIKLLLKGMSFRFEKLKSLVSHITGQLEWSSSELPESLSDATFLADQDVDKRIKMFTIYTAKKSCFIFNDLCTVKEMIEEGLKQCGIRIQEDIDEQPRIIGQEALLVWLNILTDESEPKDIRWSFFLIMLQLFKIPNICTDFFTALFHPSESNNVLSVIFRGINQCVSCVISQAQSGSDSAILEEKDTLCAVMSTFSKIASLANRPEMQEIVEKILQLDRSNLREKAAEALYNMLDWEIDLTHLKQLVFLFNQACDRSFAFRVMPAIDKLSYSSCLKMWIQQTNQETPPSNDVMVKSFIIVAYLGIFKCASLSIIEKDDYPCLISYCGNELLQEKLSVAQAHLLQKMLTKLPELLRKKFSQEVVMTFIKEDCTQSRIGSSSAAGIFSSLRLPTDHQERKIHGCYV